METEIFIGLVNSVGFPIAVSVALFYQNFKTQSMHNQTFLSFKEVINHNTKSIEKLTELVSDMKKERD